MSAPLYSRFKRYADREAKRFPKNSAIHHLIPKWKRPDTWVYSMSERASYEAGWWSGEEPSELLRAMSLHILPAQFVWIELDWGALLRGSARIPMNTPMAVTNGLTHEGQAPVRTGLLLTDLTRISLGGKKTTETNRYIVGLFFYVYPNGGCYVGPTVSAWSVTDAPIPRDDQATTDGNIGPLSTSYIGKWKAKHPRLIADLRKKTYASLLSFGYTPMEIDPVRYQAALRATEGSTRLMIAALTACLSAKRHAAGERPDTISRNEQEPRRANHRTIEVNLFMRERQGHGKSLRASVGHMEGIKKGLHKVGAHYAYRQSKDGRDPTVCPKTQFGHHDWERIDGTKSQVCMLCGQKRWFKDQHERGDEKYGIVPQKIRNVRVET